MNINKFDVTGLGSLAVDYIGSIDKWPEQGTKNPFLDFNIYDGGLTGTALCAVARQGGRAAFIGKLGNSEMAERAAASLAKEGIDLGNLIRDEISEPIIAFVLSNREKDDRNIFFRKERLGFPFPDEIPDKTWFRKTKVFFTDHVAGQAGLEAARIARENQLEIVVDIERIQDNTEGLLDVANHIIVSEKFAELYSGSNRSSDQVRALRKNPWQKLVITRGKEGCSLFKGSESLKLKGIPVEVIDTTGCGDTFHGVYALEIARGKEMHIAAESANIAAALCARKTGGRTGIPGIKELEMFRMYSKEV